jgi:hypothetical protein
MTFAKVSEKLDSFLYRKIFQKLTPADRQSAQDWCLTIIRQGHPKWTEDEIKKYYDNLLNVKVIVVDEWSRRMK